jgi:hypothetical protein
LPENFTNIIIIDKETLTSLYFQVPLHSYPISCEKKDLTVNFYKPSEEKYGRIGLDPLEILRNGGYVNSDGEFYNDNESEITKWLKYPTVIRVDFQFLKTDTQIYWEDFTSLYSDPNYNSTVLKKCKL